jgi:hypothetical protein
MTKAVQEPATQNQRGGYFPSTKVTTLTRRIIIVAEGVATNFLPAKD